MNVDPQTDRCYRIVSALLVELMFDRLTAALKEYENAKVS